MDFDPAELDALSREDLILRARARGVERPEQMTRVELRDEIVRLSEPDLERQRRSRGWLGVARDLLASVVESGLNLPDAAAAIRGDAKDIDLQGPPPVATVTLAEIYATQGHYEQALRMLEEVLQREPEHATALAIFQRLSDERDLGPGRRRRVVPTTTATPAPPAVAPVEAKPAPAPAPVAAAAPPPAPVAAAAPPPAPVAAAAPPPAPVAAAAPPPAPAAVPVPPAAQPAPIEAAAAAPIEETDEPAPQLLVLHAYDRAFVYWRLPVVSDTLRLRSLIVRPSATGPVAAEEDHPVSASVGGFWLPRFTPGTEVRAALGELTGDGFSPLSVARVLSDEEAGSFEPPGLASDSELEAAARAAARL
jgi:hypothetical protein